MHSGGRLHRGIALIAGLVGWATVAQAQVDNRVKPEIMLLIDSSGSMGFREGAERGPVCAPIDRITPANDVVYQKSRMMIAQDVLAGTTRFRHWCVEQDDAHREANHSLGGDPSDLSHYRPMCCAQIGAGDSCTAWAPCGNDHGVDDAPNDATLLGVGQAFTADGLINQELDRIKFGLMTFDTTPDPARDAGGEYSFGDEIHEVPPEIASTVGAATSTQYARNMALNQRRPNLGARNAEAQFGGLVRSDQGLLQDDGQVQKIAQVGETPDRVRKHNRLVMERVRRIVPYGFTPIAPLLADAVTYFDEELEEDRGAACRKRFAVLITDGAPTDYYGGQSCVADRDCNPGGQAFGGECVPVLTRVEPLRICPCGLGQFCSGGVCYRQTNVCSYPEGFPYKSSEEYAAEMFERNIPLFVIGFNVNALAQAKGRAIATAGSPGMGITPEEPGFFLASDETQLRAALRRISNAALAGLRTRAKPLVISPAAGDDTGNRKIRQWRFFTFSEVPGSSDDARYGRVESVELGCQDNAEAGRGLVDLGTIRFDEKLADRAVARRSVTRNPADDTNIPVTGGENPMFNDDGTLGPRLGENLVRTLTQAPLGENNAEGDDKLRVIGRLVNGYFGERGLPEGASSDTVGEKQIGEVLEGDVIAIQPPNLGIQSPAYETFAKALEKRPSMVAVGARDGMVHLFRATDGEEVLAFVPRLPWRGMREGHFAADGPLDSTDVAECRTLGEAGDEDCPAELAQVKFRTVLAGGLGRGGANLFGVDLTNIADLAKPASDLAQLEQAHFNDGQREYIWDVTDTSVDNSTLQESKLGLAISRPIITHVRQNDRIVAAVIVGCGEDPDVDGAARAQDADGVGRCVLVLNAVDGSLIRRIETPTMDRPMIGSPVVYPVGGIAPAERAYIGDRVGRMWRLDLRSTDPAEWSAEVAWPPQDEDEALGYQIGRAVTDRPSVALRENGRLVVLFTTTEDGDDSIETSYVVSFDDEVQIDEEGEVSYVAHGNWVMPLLPGEYATGAPVVRAEVAYFTTIQPTGGDVCVTAQGRLYGVHFTDTYLDDEGEPDTFTRTDPEGGGAVELNVQPALPLYNNNGAPSGDRALAILLPPGRVAHGLAIVSTPSCIDGEAAATEIVLNLADESQGAAGAVNANNLKVEQLNRETGSITAALLDRRLFVKSGAHDLTVCLDCDKDGNAAAVGAARVGPFPAVVTYWGSTFSH